MLRHKIIYLNILATTTSAIILAIIDTNLELGQMHGIVLRIYHLYFSILQLIITLAITVKRLYTRQPGTTRTKYFFALLIPIIAITLNFLIK